MQKVEAIFNKITNYGLYLLAFLTPFFFLPYTHLPVLANRQLLAAAVCGLLLLVWVVKIMATGKVLFRWSKTTVAVLILLFVLGLSTVFSAARQQSFWGMAFEPDTFFSFILYGLVFLLSSNLIESRTEALRLLKLFLVGCGVLAVLFLVSALFGPVFPWEFAKAAGFNPVGTIYALAVLLGGALMVDVVLISEVSEGLKKKISPISPIRPIGLIGLIGLIVIGILLLSALVLINHWAAWVLVGLTCLLIVWVKGFNKDVVLPVCLLVLSLLFVVLHVPSNRLLNLPGEVVLSYGASTNIAKDTLFQGVHRFLFGSGPSTFAQDYDLFRPMGVNATAFWQSRFTQGNAVLLTLLATTGVLGVLALLFLLATFLYFGFKAALVGGVGEFREVGDFREGSPATPTPPNSPNSPNSPTIFIVGFYFLLTWFFYSMNFSLMFFGFLFLGLWAAISRGKSAGFELKGMQPQHSFFIMLLCIALIVGVVAGFYRVGRNYAAALAFEEGVELVRSAGPDLEKGIEKLTWAAETAKNDSYFRNLSQAFLARAGQVLNNTEMTEKAKQELLQGLIDAAEVYASKAIVINQQNSQNWVNIAGIYVVLVRDLGIAGAGGLAISSYERAKNLAPKDPSLLYKTAFANVLSAERTRRGVLAMEASEERDENLVEALKSQRMEQLEEAVRNLQKALVLKPDFTEAAQLLDQLIVK